MKKKINYKRLAKMYRGYKDRIYAKRTPDDLNEKLYNIYYLKQKNDECATIEEHIFYTDCPPDRIAGSMRICLKSLIHEDRMKDLINKKYYLSDLK